MSGARSTREVIDNHLRHRMTGDLDADLAHNYAPDVVVLSYEGVSRGHESIRRLAEVLRTYVPSAGFHYDHVEVADGYALVEWSAPGAGRPACEGADSYVIENGRIVGQTIHYSTITVPPTRRGSTVRRRIQAAPERVFDVLADGWSYAGWVVGAARVRAVDEGWPQPGSAIHHSVGGWPLLLHDRTESLDADPPGHLVLRARGWPAGEARVEVSIAADGNGSLVTLTETPAAGPIGTVLWPILRLVLPARNRESLTRLAAMAEQHPPH